MFGLLPIVMNLAFYLFHFLDKSKRLLYFLSFVLFQKPLYRLSYNVKGNFFSCNGRLYNSSVKIIGINHKIVIEKGVRMNNACILITGKNNKLIIHRNVIFSEGGRIKLEGENNIIEIGQKSDFVDCFLAASDCNSKIIIGEDCMFSANVIIRNSDVHPILNENGERINYAEDTVLGNKIWVGYGANILKGVHIGDGSVVGTQSVVTRINIPNESIIAGNPARIVKRGIHWSR